MIGLYRDNGLAAINNADGPNLDRIRKDVIALFKEEGLSIIIETNLNERHLLDITFNLQQRNIFLFERLTIRQSTSTPFLNIRLQSSNSRLKWSAKEFQIYLVIRKSSAKLNLSIKHPLKDSGHFRRFLLIIATFKTLKETETERSYGSTHHIAKMWTRILVNCWSTLWRSTFSRTTNTIIFST